MVDTAPSLRATIFEYIEGFYNRERTQKRLDHKPRSSSHTLQPREQRVHETGSRASPVEAESGALGGHKDTRWNRRPSQAYSSDVERSRWTLVKCLITRRSWVPIPPPPTTVLAGQTCRSSVAWRLPAIVLDAAKQSLRAHVAGELAGDLDATMAPLSDDPVWLIPGYRLAGREAVRAMYEMALKALRPRRAWRRFFVRSTTRTSPIGESLIV